MHGSVRKTCPWFSLHMQRKVNKEKSKVNTQVDKEENEVKKTRYF
jgi:hypothetical protein